MNKKELLEFLKKLEQLKKEKQNQEQKTSEENENEIEPGTPSIAENPSAGENQKSCLSDTDTTQASESRSETPREETNSPSPKESLIEDLNTHQGTKVPTPFVGMPEKLKPKNPKKEKKVTTIIQVPTLSDTILASELKQKNKARGELLLLFVAFTTITYLFNDWRKKKEPYSSFYLSTNMFQSKVKLGEFVVFTKHATKFQEELEIDEPLEPFMIGKIIGILNEAQRLVILEVFPRKKHYFRSKINFITPFIYLDDLEGSSFYKFVLFIEDLFETFQDFFFSLKYYFYS